MVYFCGSHLVNPDEVILDIKGNNALVDDVANPVYEDIERPPDSRIVFRTISRGVMSSVFSSGVYRHHLD